MSRIFKVSLALLLSSTLFASGWKIPEQSANSIALSGSYVANVSGAETAYYNPANMGFNQNKNHLSLSLTNIMLNQIDYTDSRNQAYSSSSQKEVFYMPTFFYSSKHYGDFNYGISFTVPGGLSKRWEDTYAKTFAHEFSLRVMELNPVVSYKVNDRLSVAVGLRAIYSDGVVKSEGVVSGFNIRRDMKGDAVEYGYNLALAYKALNNSNLSMTYRSNIDIKEQGAADLYISGTKSYSGGASVTIPLPAVLDISYAYRLQKTIFEFSYEKTYWSKYKELDFEYEKAVTNPLLKAAFDNPSRKDWKDTVTKRLGITYNYSDKLNLMCGYAIDEVAAPNSSLSFELPDSNSKMYSLGYEYKLGENSSYSFGYLYNKKESREVSNSNMAGKIENGVAYLTSITYKKIF